MKFEIEKPQPKGRVVKCRLCGKVYDLGERTLQRHERLKCPFCGAWQLHLDPRVKAQRELEKKKARPISYEQDAFSVCPARRDVYGLTNGEIIRTSLVISKPLHDEIRRRAKAKGLSMAKELERVLYVHYAEIIAAERKIVERNR